MYLVFLLLHFNLTGTMSSISEVTIQDAVSVWFKKYKIGHCVLNPKYTNPKIIKNDIDTNVQASFL